MNSQDRFSDLFAPIRGMLRGFLYAGTRNMHDADDLLQQVGSVLWAKFAQYDPSKPFSVWAVGMARVELMKWRDRAVRNSRLRSLSDEAIHSLAEAAAKESPEVADREELAAMESCLASLEAKARQAMELKYRDGKSIKEIAAIQGRETGAVEMSLVRSRRSVRKCVELKLGMTSTTSESEE